MLTGVHSLLQDKAGDVVKISFYPPEIQQCSDFNSQWKLGHQMFPQGIRVEIFEPFFKQAMDSTYLVRVDNMADVKMNPLTEPMTLTDFNAEGKNHVNAKQYDEAQASYCDGIKYIIDSQPMYKILFQNLALVHLNLKQPEAAL